MLWPFEVKVVSVVSTSGKSVIQYTGCKQSVKTLAGDTPYLKEITRTSLVGLHVLSTLHECQHPVEQLHVPKTMLCFYFQLCNTILQCTLQKVKITLWASSPCWTYSYWPTLLAINTHLSNVIIFSKFLSETICISAAIHSIVPCVPQVHTFSIFIYQCPFSMFSGRALGDTRAFLWGRAIAHQHACKATWACDSLCMQNVGIMHYI